MPQEIPIPAPPLHPKWAVRFTLLTFPLGLLLVFLAHQYLLTAWHIAFAWYALIAYIIIAYSWSFLEWPSRNSAIRGNNFFVLTAIALVIIATITTRQGESFSMWAIAIGILAAIAGYSVAGVYAVRNFLHWRKGQYAITADPAATNI
jgi:hypothetical protein